MNSIFYWLCLGLKSMNEVNIKNIKGSAGTLYLTNAPKTGVVIPVIINKHIE
jgi:hypothetical protein